MSGVYELPRRIWVDYGVLGQKFETRVGPVRTEVIMPKLNSAHGRVVAPDLAGVPAAALASIVGDRPPRLDAYPNPSPVIDPEWCTEYAAWNPPRSTALRAVGMELFDDPGLDLSRWSVHRYLPDQMLDVVGRRLEGWYSRVAEWISILTGQDLNHHHQLFDATLVAPGFRVWGDAVWRQGALTASVPQVDPIDAGDLREVLTRAGDGERPPLEWQLMLTGSRALDRGYLRPAVADFATAMEVCLTRMVRNSTSAANPPGVKSNLRTWSDWLIKNDPDAYTKPSAFDAAADLRNAVLHRGEEPDYEQVRAAYDCACSIVVTHGLPARPWRVTPPGAAHR